MDTLWFLNHRCLMSKAVMTPRRDTAYPIASTDEDIGRCRSALPATYDVTHLNVRAKRRPCAGHLKEQLAHSFPCP
jgi:hypothetical protein